MRRLTRKQSSRQDVVAEDDSPVDEQILPGSDRLYLFFGGVWGEIGLPKFEFYRAAQVLDASRIFVRDTRKSLYHAGLPGIGDDVESLAEYFAEKIDASGASEIRFVGNCLGAYAALLFSGMLRRGRVIAFVPAVFLDKANRVKYQDRRSQPLIDNMYRARGSESELFDLPKYLSHRYPEIEADVYFSNESRIDLVHAKLLEPFENIRIHEYSEGGSHTIVKWLRDKGMLSDILAG